MWLMNYSVCLFKGHDCSELTSDGNDYTYCHRCGRIKESRQPDTVPAGMQFAAAPRPTRVTMPIDKIFH